MSIMRWLIASQRRLSYWLDHTFLPSEYSVDGDTCFGREFLTPYLERGLTIIDVGSGKHPIISASRKATLGIRVIGLDISPSELEAAPSGSYDSTICADITQFVGDEAADIVVCSALLEHVRNTERALRAIASLLKPGGRALVFIPNRNALASRLNLLIPQKYKVTLLHWLFPEMQGYVGFPAYYDRCTPHHIIKLAEASGFLLEKRRVYFGSGYFTVFVPAHVLWRVWQLTFRTVVRDEAAETFSLALRKSASLKAAS
jgi:2-polyprenyl-6-hydroxyphenyl methylase/3-demethylubiquinone-9 3-methyltransferase